jgi:hypothetical protein
MPSARSVARPTSLFLTENRRRIAGDDQPGHTLILGTDVGHEPAEHLDRCGLRASEVVMTN